MNGVLFSSFIPEHNIELGLWYVEVIKKYFYDCEVVCGVAGESCQVWVDIVKDNFSNVVIVDKSLTLNSDATGFLYGLEKILDKDYECLWLIHTKGASYPSKKDSEFIRCYFENNLFSKKDLATNILLDGIHGSIGLDLLYHSNKSIDNFWEKYFNNKSKDSNYFYPNTIYAIRFDLISDFLKKNFNNIKDDIYKLEDRRYFFEAYFQAIIDKFGFSGFSIKG